MTTFRKTLNEDGTSTKGFTLVELMIVVAIIGILATLSAPLYLSYRKKAIQVEAKTNLLNIHKFEMMYYSEYEFYSNDANELSFEVKTNPKYEYKITASANSFTAEARGNIDSDDEEDVWTINDKQVMEHVTAD